MSNKTKSKRVKMLLLAILLVPLFQACSIVDTGVCSHPWIVVGFDAENIGTTVGKIETWMYRDSDNGIVAVQIGLEPFDQIAREFGFYRMVPMYSTNEYPKKFYEKYGVYPMNVFLIEVFGKGEEITSSLFQAAVDALLEDINIPYVSSISCAKSYCRETLFKYTSIGGRK